MADRISDLQDFVREIDRDLHRSFPFQVAEVRDSGDPERKNWYQVVGHAAVYNRWSLDLGGFRERIKKGAFDNVLSRDPHVLHTIDHDTSKTLSSTRSHPPTLELRSDPQGLRYFSQIKPTTYALDLRMNLEDGTINQSSFAFTVAKDEWRITEEDGEEHVERTIEEVEGLFDVTTCAMGAYPSTDAALALRSLICGRSFPSLEGKRAAILVAPELEGEGEQKEVAPEATDPAGTPRTPNEGVADKREIARLKSEAQEAARVAKERLYRRVSS